VTTQVEYVLHVVYPCSLEVDVWLSGGSDTQNTQRHMLFILVWASEPYVQQYGFLRVRNARSKVSYNNGVQRLIDTEGTWEQILT